MSSRLHTRLRLGAIVLLATALLWPRPSATAARSYELVRTSRTTETSSVKRDERPRTLKVIVADADDARLTN
jgi:hypothetical protein